jgi:O-antigen/teichoic acid export membrane protein
MTHSKKIFRNSAFAVINKILMLILAFVLRKVFIMFLSEELLGLNSLFADLLGLLNLADMGLAVAVQFNLYKPIAEKNHEKIARILNATKRIYNVIGIAIVVIGIILSFFIQFLIKDNPYDLNFLRIVFIMNVISSASSYFFVHNRIYMQASENLHMIDKIDMGVNLAGTVLRIVTLALFRNYYLYVILAIVQAVVSNLLISISTKRHHAFLKTIKGYTKDETQPLFANIKELIPNKISAYIFSNTDNTIISATLGLASVTYFTNYNSISLQLFSLAAMISGVIRASFGNVLQEEHNPKLHMRFLQSYQLLQFFYSAFCGVTFFCLADEFISLWYGAKYVAPLAFVIILTLDFYAHSMYQPLSMMLEVLGEFRALKRQEIFAMILNLTISIALVFPFGIIGPILGTFAVDLCTTVFRIYTILYKHYRSFMKDYIKRYALYTGLFIAEYIGLYLLCNLIPLPTSIVSLLVKCAICFLCTCPINLLIFRKSEEFSYLKDRLLHLTKKEG